MRRVAVLIALALLGLLTACEAEDPAPDPSPADDGDEPSDDEAPDGLRVGVVLPPAAGAPADEIADADAVEALADGRDDVIDVRAVVPDAAAFVPDAAELLARERDLVCVLGDGAVDAVAPLVELYGDTRWCVAPADPTATWPEGVVAVDVAVEELGAMVGAGLSALHDDEDASSLALLADARTERSGFRAGLRAATDGLDLAQRTGSVEDLQAELADAEDPVGVLVDGGADHVELAERAADRAPVLAPVGLLGDDGPSAALTWALRWAPVVDRALAGHLGEADGPGRLGAGSAALEVTVADDAPDGMGAAVSRVRESLVSGARDPLEPDDPSEADGEDGADGEGGGGGDDDADDDRAGVGDGDDADTDTDDG